MATSFSRTMRSLDDRGPRPARLLVVLVIGALWAWWMFRGEVSVYATSTTARLEVTGLPRRVAAQEGGRIVALHLDLGRTAREGDVLVELDGTLEERQRDEARARLASLEPKLAALRDQLATARAVRASRWDLNAATIERARAELGAAETIAEREQKLHGIAERLSDAQLLSGTDKVKAEGDLADSKQRVTTAAAELARLESSQKYEDRVEAAHIAELMAKLAELESERSTAVTQVETASAQLERRRVRAPATGKLGTISALQIGDVVKPGDVLAVVVPSDDIHVVAELPPSAVVGRVLPGQRAHVRLSGFSWTQYGMLDARVASVANEPHDGSMRVELVLDRAFTDRVPIQHGLPGAVDIEVERVSPWTLVVRSLGATASPPAPPASSGIPVAVTP